MFHIVSPPQVPGHNPETLVPNSLSFPVFPTIPEGLPALRPPTAHTQAHTSRHLTAHGHPLLITMKGHLPFLFSGLPASVSYTPKTKIQLLRNRHLVSWLGLPCLFSFCFASRCWCHVGLAWKSCNPGKSCVFHYHSGQVIPTGRWEQQLVLSERQALLFHIHSHGLGLNPLKDICLWARCCLFKRFPQKTSESKMLESDSLGRVEAPKILGHDPWNLEMLPHLEKDLKLEKWFGL